MQCAVWTSPSPHLASVGESLQALLQSCLSTGSDTSSNSVLMFIVYSISLIPSCKASRDLYFVFCYVVNSPSFLMQMNGNVQFVFLCLGYFSNLIIPNSIHVAGCIWQDFISSVVDAIPLGSTTTLFIFKISFKDLFFLNSLCVHTHVSTDTRGS